MSKQNQVYLYGIHTLHSLLQRLPENILQLYVAEERQDARLQALTEQAKALGLAVLGKHKQALTDVCGSDQHQGVVALCRLPTAKGDQDLPALLDAISGPALLLLLDQVQDPHNLGACLRSADACGVQAVIAPRDRAAPLSAVAFKVSSGAALAVPYLQVTNLARTADYLKQRGIWLVGASGGATESLYNMDLRGPTAFVLGSEGQGMRRLVQEKCDYLIRIPMAGLVESLNVSVATGVCLFEAVRQRSV